MTSGGARTRSGPLADPNSLRSLQRGMAKEWTVLPATGREGEAPSWPLSGQSPREAELWRIYWRKPQAIIWERDHLVEMVALFVRQFCEAEKPFASAENRKTVRMMFADLWLTPDSMVRARLKIEKVDPNAAPATAPKAPSARDRLLKAVPDAPGS